MSVFLSREKFESLQTRLAASYGVASFKEMFTVDPPKAVALISQIMQTVGFLSTVSVIPVTDSKGDIVMLNAPGTIAGRTDTSENERTVQILGDKSARSYEVRQTNYDVGLKYAEIDAWRRFSDYDKRILAMVYRRIALDQLLIGWYGESCAKATNRTTCPLLQDVNTGWIYDLKTNKAENYIKADAGSKLKLGKSGDWENLDQLAFELLSLIPEEHRTGDEIVIVGRKIVAWESGKIFAAHGQTPSEKTLFNVLSKTYGGLPATSPAGFPDTGVMVTDPKNLQIYVQENSLRRQMIDNPKRDQIEYFQSQNECYRIGDLDAAAAVKHDDVEFVTASSSAASGSGADPETPGA